MGKLNKVVKKFKEIVNVINKNHFLSKVTMFKDYIFAAIKIILGIFFLSYFLCVSGLYSICVGFAKTLFFEGKKQCGSYSDESLEYKSIAYKYLAQMATFILAGSIVYIIYMSRLFFISSVFNYGMIPSITIALISFTEITLAIIGLKKSKGVLNWGLKCINLTSAFTAIVLTQVAILSFTNNTDNSFYNAIAGTIFGGLCIIIAILMLIRYTLIKTELKNNINKNIADKY